MPLILSGSAGLSGNVGTTTKEMLPAGSVLQVVQGVLLSRASTTSGSFLDAGLSATITPFSLSSKILVSVCLSGVGAATAGGVLGTRLVRGATNILLANSSGSAVQTSGGAGGFGDTNSTNGSVAIEFLDSPATTNSTTYKVQFASTYNGIQVVIGGSNNNAGIYNLTTPSIITLTEIKG